MPNESLNIYLTAIDKASPVLASITDKTKALNKESQQLQQTYDALQKANRSLIERKTELQRKSFLAAPIRHSAACPPSAEGETVSAEAGQDRCAAFLQMGAAVPHRAAPSRIPMLFARRIAHLPTPLPIFRASITQREAESK